MEYQLEEFEPKHIKKVLKIYQTNHEYFENVHPSQIIDEQCVMNDVEGKPENVNSENKHYCIIKEKSKYIGVIDYLENYPYDGCAYIGLFMIDGELHNQNLGHDFINWFENKCKSNGFNHMRLGVVDTNTKAYRFWQSFGLKRIKTVETDYDEITHWVIHVMEKEI